jgi:prophage antirepressor-like protein
MDTILFHFESSEIRFVGTADNPAWIAADICKVLGISNVSDTLSSFSASQKGIVSTDDGSLTGSQMLTVTEAGMYRLIFKSRKPVAEKFQNWIFNEVLPSIRKTGSYSIDQGREKLEKKFKPLPTTQNYLDALKIAKAAKLPIQYIQRLGMQSIKQICPGLEAPNPTELASLPTTRALLTPTKIAEELNLLYKTGSGNGSKVNTLLKDLGYQDMIGGRWSATNRAIEANLVDRKPVDTNSRTQKDQLLWSADIITILQEHLVAV